jgi:hypothetical protein
MIERYQETTLERRARYLRLAREAKELAAKSKTLQMREACLAMAQSWLALATDLDSGRSEALRGWSQGLEGVSVEGAGPNGVLLGTEPIEPAAVALDQ